MTKYGSKRMLQSIIFVIDFSYSEVIKNGNYFALKQEMKN